MITPPVGGKTRIIETILILLENLRPICGGPKEIVKYLAVCLNYWGGAFDTDTASNTGLKCQQQLPAYHAKRESTAKK